MASTWLEPGGDADGGVGLWTIDSGAPAAVSDILHGNHARSIKFRAANQDVLVKTAILGNSGRASVWYYFNALPTATARIMYLKQTAGGTTIVKLVVKSDGTLELFENSVQIGVDGTKVVTGQWYELTLNWNLTSTTINRIILFKNNVSDIDVTNATLSAISPVDFRIGNGDTDTTLDLRGSDIYLDNSNSSADVGQVWVTAKIPISNGTTNGFTTQIGSGGSGIGTGHAPQVNERPNSDSNGWSVINAGSAITEEYNIQSVSAGDIDITGATIVDYMGWVRSKALTTETASIVVNNVNSNISLTTSIQFFTKIAGSTSYPAGTGTDIGEITSTTVTTVSLYEAGVVVAYIPVVVVSSISLGYKTLLGVGI